MSVRVLLLLGILGACGDDGVMPAFPEDYASTYTEVRDCRQSGDHDLNQMRVLVDPAGLVAYRDRTEPFPEGAVVIKEEYDFGDTDCAGPIKQWTVMERLAEETGDTLGWYWQRVDAERNVVGEDTPRCWGCHTGCNDAAGGYQWTCTLP